MKSRRVVDPDAVEKLANYMIRYSTATAKKRMKEEAKFSRQSLAEVARRTAANILCSFEMRK